MPDRMGRPLGEHLRSCRIRADVTIQAAAAKTGLSMSSISDWEKDKRTPTIAQIETLVGAYGLTFFYSIERGARRDA